MSLYAVDWDSYNRAETIYVEDTSGNVLPSVQLSAFHGGEYVSWNITGHVRFLVVRANSGSNTVILGYLL